MADKATEQKTTVPLWAVVVAVFVLILLFIFGGDDLANALSRMG